MATETTTQPEEPKIELTEREKAIAAAPLVGASQGLSIVPEDPDTPAGEDKPVAENVSEDTPAETPPKETAVSPKDERFRQVAESLGIPIEDAKQFDTPEELTRAVMWRDGQFVSAQQSAMKAHDENNQGDATKASSPPQDEQAEEQEHLEEVSEEQQQPVQQQVDPKGKFASSFDPQKYEEEGYDEDTVSMAKDFKSALDGLQQHIESQLGAGQFAVEQAMEAAQQQEFNSFHDVLDGIEDDRFGKTLNSSGSVSDITEEQKQNRSKVGEQFVMLRDHLASQGQALPPVASLVRRARMQAFAEDIEKETRKAVHGQIRNQTKRRISAPGRGSAASATGEHDAENVADHPSMVELWDQFQEANSTT